MSIKLKHSGGNSVSLNPPTSAPTSSEVAFKLPNADGSSGQYMKTDGSGNLAFATVATGVDGITMADTWVMTAGFNTGTTYLTDDHSDINWSRQTSTYGGFGSAMTESGGVFTFPSTGHYYVQSTISGFANGGARHYIGNVHYISTNSGSSYSEKVQAYTSAYADSAHWSVSVGDIYDITNATTTRLKLRFTSNGANNILGSTSGNIGLSGITFIRLGDT